MIKICYPLVLMLLLMSHPGTGASIYETIRQGDLEGTGAILDSIPELINVPDTGNMTPLCIASAQGSVDIAELLLDKGADLAIGDADNSQPIHYAALAGHTAVVELLVSHGADIDARDNNGTTPLIFAISYRQPNTARWLVDHGTNVSIANNRNVTPLHYAVVRGFGEIAELILEKGAIVDAVDEDQETPLHYAAQTGNIEIAGRLLEYGASVTARNGYGRTPLLLTARESGDVEMARFLIDHGSDIDTRDNEGDTPLTLSAWRGFKATVNLLIDRGAKLPSVEEELGQLANYAADRGLAGLFRALAQTAASINSESVTGGTLLHQAARGGSEAIITILVEHGWDVNGRDRYGRTPLHYAAENGREAAVRALISHGAELNLRSLSGRTPFNVAEQYERHQVATMLEESGADASPVEFPRLTGPFLGQKLPGSRPQQFAPDIVSTHQFEHGCVTFMPNGKEIYWTSSIRPADSGYTTGFIMSSRIENGQWTIPQLASFSRIGLNDDIPVITPDGKRLFFLSRRGPRGMWYVVREDNSWSEPTYIEGGPNELRPYWQFSVSARGNIYFASRGDIYVSRPVDNHYTSPQMLDSTINTPFDEGQVCVAPDESFLIYGTDGYPDSLDGDCFRIVFRNERGTWDTPKRILADGDPLTGICPVLSPDGKYLFFNDMSTGTTDIYWIEASFLKSIH